MIPSQIPAIPIDSIELKHDDFSLDQTQARWVASVSKSTEPAEDKAVVVEIELPSSDSPSPAGFVSLSAAKMALFMTSHCAQSTFTHQSLQSLAETAMYYEEGMMHGAKKKVLFGTLEPRSEGRNFRATQILKRALTREETLIDCRPHHSEVIKYEAFQGVVFNPEGKDDEWSAIKNLAFFAGGISQSRTFCLVTPLRYFMDGGKGSTINEILTLLAHGYDAQPNPENPAQTLFYPTDLDKISEEFENYWVTRQTMSAAKNAEIASCFQDFVGRVEKLRSPLVDKSGKSDDFVACYHSRFMRAKVISRSDATNWRKAEKAPLSVPTIKRS